MIDQKRNYKRYRFPGIPCLLKLEKHDTYLSGEIIDASEGGVFLYLSEGMTPPVEWSIGDLSLEDLQVPFRVTRAGKTTERLWLAAMFINSSPAILQRLIAINDEKTGVSIAFYSLLSVSELSYRETLFQLAMLHLALDAAAHILFILRIRYNINTGRILPPRILSINTSSPLKGVVETAKDVVNVVKSADDIIRHRQELTALKKEEVKQARERTRQEKSRTTQESAKATVATIDAIVHEYCSTSEALARRLDIYKNDIQLSREEVSLFREKLAALKDAWHFSKEVFGEGSEELHVLQHRLLPAMLFLVEDSAGLRLRLPGFQSVDDSQES